MEFTTASGKIEATIEQMVIAGWTGRDAAAVQHHIDELAVLGVAPPSQVPLFYRVASSLLTTRPWIEVLGPDTSGEAEPMVVRHDGRVWLGLASDHTDRALEVTSIAASKQVCAKPCAAQLWAWEDVADHLDRLTLRSWIHEGGDWCLYQDGSLAQIRPLQDLCDASDMGPQSAILCGTLGAIGGVRPAARFRATLGDPVRDREITFEYEARALPVIS